MKLLRMVRPDADPASPESHYQVTSYRQGSVHADSMADKPTGNVARERRTQQAIADLAKLREGLTAPQLATLATMQQFKWELRFVRRPMFLDPVPVLFSRDGKRIAVLEADGSIDENPGFKIRP